MKLKQLLGKGYIKIFVKVSVSLLCIFFLFRKISFPELMLTLKQANFYYLFFSAIFFVLSKLFSAIRLQKYLQNIRIPLKPIENTKLYWLGMFYNLFLPGGIGGDAYKAYYLNKQFPEVKLKHIVSTLLKDRFSGLFTICIILLILASFIGIQIAFSLVFAGIVALALGLYLTEKLVPPDSSRYLMYTSFFSLLVQVSQVISVVLILLSLDVHEHYAEVSFIFLLSTIVAMFPVTIGGIGLRELTFLYFASYFHQDKDVYVSVAFLFFVVSSVSSLPGMYYHFRPDQLMGKHAAGSAQEE